MSTDTSQTWLSTPSIPAAVATVASAFLRLRAGASSVIAQRDVELDLIPTLPQTQALAREHLHAWLNDYQTQLLQSLVDVGAFGNAFEEFAEEFLKLAPGVDAGSTSDRNELIQGLGDLRQELARVRTQLSAQRQQVELSRNSLQDDDTRFQTDEESVVEHYTGPGGELSSLQATLKAYQDQLETDNEIVANGATQAIPGILITTVGIGIDILAASQESPAGKKIGDLVLNAGLDMAKGAIAKVDAARADVTATIAKYKATLIELSGETLEVGVFETVRRQVTNAAAQSAQAYSAQGALDQAWEDVDDGLDLVVQTLKGQTLPPPGELVAQFQAGVDFWKQMRAQVGAFEQVLSNVQESALRPA